MYTLTNTTLLFILLATAMSAQSKMIEKLHGEPISTAAIDAFVQQQMSLHQIPGLSMVIINDAEVVYHHTAGYADLARQQAVTADTIFEGASLSKPLFAFLAMQFVEQGQLDLDKPLYEYLPYPDIAHDARYKNITARMVLAHSSGFPNWRTDYPDDKLFIKFQPGSGYEYSGEAYQYLALVLAHIANTDARGLERLFQQQVAKPLGMEHTQFMQSDAVLNRRAKPHKAGKGLAWDQPNQAFGAAYSVHSEALDFAKWVTALLKERLLSETTYDQYFAPQNTPIPADHETRAFGLVDWALGFSVFKLPKTIHYHGGNNPGFTSMVVLDRTSKWGLVLFTNQDQATAFQLALFEFLMKPRP